MLVSSGAVGNTGQISAGLRSAGREGGTAGGGLVQNRLRCYREVVPSPRPRRLSSYLLCNNSDYCKLLTTTFQHHRYPKLEFAQIVCLVGIGSEKLMNFSPFSLFWLCIVFLYRRSVKQRKSYYTK